MEWGNGEVGQCMAGEMEAFGHCRGTYRSWVVPSVRDGFLSAAYQPQQARKVLSIHGHKYDLMQDHVQQASAYVIRFGSAYIDESPAMIRHSQNGPALTRNTKTHLHHGTRLQLTPAPMYAWKSCSSIISFVNFAVCERHAVDPYLRAVTVYLVGDASCSTAMLQHVADPRSNTNCRTGSIDDIKKQLPISTSCLLRTTVSLQATDCPNETR